MKIVPVIEHYSNLDYNVLNMSGYPRIANKNARQYVEEWRPFLGSNLYAVSQCGLYVIYSYGRHYPLAVYDPAVLTWFSNCDRYSRSTTRHQQQCGWPGQDRPRTTEQLTAIVLAGGFLNAVDKRLAA